jgi:uncharacterized membrane protein (DUF106 family)
MAVLNALLRPLFDLIQAPMASWPSWIGILIWSIPVSVFALWIFKRFSNQDRIAAVKAKIYGCLFEIRLFNDDIRAIFRAQWEIMGHVLHYQALALKPMLWILPPLVLIMVHLHGFYGFRGLKPGEQALVTVAVSNTDSSVRPDMELRVPDGVALETPGVWAADLGEMAWRIRADVPGDYSLVVTNNGAEAVKSLRVTDLTLRLSPERPDVSFWGQLEWPSEKPLQHETGLHRITLSYPEATVAFLGFEMESQWAWMILFFVLTMIIALALKKPMGVEL